MKGIEERWQDRSPGIQYSSAHRGDRSLFSERIESLAHVYSETVHGEDPNFSLYRSESRCFAFLTNINKHRYANVTFLGQKYNILPWSISILWDCRNTTFDTAKLIRENFISNFTREQDPNGEKASLLLQYSPLPTFKELYY